MDKTQLPAILALVTPGVIQRIAEEPRTDYAHAADILYKSKLYAALENPKTGLWKLSPLTLYTLLWEELTTGMITFPEEQ